MGVYIGTTLHEVANVAVTIKMIRVILLVPLLLILPLLITRDSQKSGKQKLSIPWFAFLFLAMVVSILTFTFFLIEYWAQIL